MSCHWRTLFLKWTSILSRVAWWFTGSLEWFWWEFRRWHWEVFTRGSIINIFTSAIFRRISNVIIKWHMLFRVCRWYVGNIVTDVFYKDIFLVRIQENNNYWNVVIRASIFSTIHKKFSNGCSVSPLCKMLGHKINSFIWFNNIPQSITS